MVEYGQFRPVAKTAELFAERWTPLIIGWEISAWRMRQHDGALHLKVPRTPWNVPRHCWD